MLQRSQRAVEIAACGGEEATAAAGRGQRRSTVDLSCLALENVEQVVCLLQATERDQRLDVIGDEPHRAGLPDTARLETGAERAE